MKGSGASLCKANATSPKPTDARKHMRRKYYNMRCRSFQGIVGNEERMIFMTSILEEFAYGNLSPQVCAFRHDSEYGEVLRVLSLNEERLLARLNEEDKNTFENYVGAQGELNRLTAVGNLIYGYRLGLTMTAEAFVGMDDLIFGKTDN